MNEKTHSAAMDRLRARAAAHAELVDTVARILWENGEMLADTEGGSMPTWQELAHLRAHPEQCESAAAHGAFSEWWLSHTRKAQALLDLDARSSLQLGQILITHAGTKFEQLELDLWRKIERAKGFEPGSLTGAPGVRQQVAL